MTYHCFSRQLVKARKPHRCVWCSYPILLGSSYLREHSVYDGRFQNFAWHEACSADAERWFKETREEEFYSGHDMPFHALYALELSRIPDIQIKGAA